MGNAILLGMGPELAALARRQHGVFSHAQALALGETSWSVRAALAYGGWIRVEHRVYATATSPLSFPARLHAVRLAVPEPFAFSHGTAALLWDLPLPCPTTPQIVVPHARRLVLLQSTALRARRGLDPVYRRGFPVTRLEVTVRQVASGLSPTRLERLVEHLLRERLTTPGRLRDQFGRGRPGTAALRCPRPSCGRARQRLEPSPRTLAGIGRAARTRRRAPADVGRR